MKHLVLRRYLQASCSSLLTSKSSLITLKRTLAVFVVIGILSGCGVVHDVSAAAQATVSPTSVTWGNVAIGNAGGPKPVTFTNNSASTITFTSFAFNGTDASDFAIYQNTCGKSLAPAASCTTTILFKPVSTGVRTAALVFTDSDPTSPQEVSVSGTGTGSVTIAPSSLSFGSITVGSKSSAQTITISNTTSSSVTLTAPSFSGTDPGDFSASSTTCGASLAASSSCTASVVFSPAATGSRSATFSITENSTALSTSLSGTGSASATGNVSASPTSVTWGSVAVGSTSGAKSVTLTNTGSTVVSISSIAFAGTNAGDFSISQNSCGTSLAATSTCTIGMLFKPTAAGTRTATLTFTDNDASSPQQVAVSGTATGGSNSGTVSVSPTSLSYGTVNEGSTSSAQTITISNGTSSSATLSSGSITGTNAADFSVQSTTCGSSLAAAGSCTASIVFKPSTTAAENATWTMTSDSTTLSVSLSGTGASGSTSGNVTASPTSVTWASVAVGNAGGQKVVTLTNSGSSAVTINSIGFTGTDPGDFSIFSKTCGTSLAASSSCTVNILFKPTVAGTRTATLNFNDSDSSSPQQVSVSGLGTGGSVSASPTSLSFGTVNEGSSSSSQTITVTNGTSSSVSLSSGSIAGTNAADFSIQSTTCGSSLAASGTCTAAIVFTPSATGVESATWTMTSGSTTLSVSLSGTGSSGSSGNVTASPASVSFGTVNEGSTSSSQTITVSNTTSSSVSLGTAAITGTNAGDFTVSSTTCGSSLAASGTCTAAVVFKPSTTGLESATWTMTSGSTNLSVSLSGTGASGATGFVTPSPTSLTWGSVAVGNTSGAKTVTLTNSGTTSVSISSIAFTGTNAGDFSQTNTCGSSLAASSSCTVSLLFKPTLAGTRTATLNFTDSDPSSPQQVAVSGTGTGGSGSGTVSTSPTSITFGSVTIGASSASQTITVTNGTTASVTLGTGTITGTNAGDFSISSTNCGSTLAASGTCTASIAFKPTASGTRTASWEMTVSSSSTALSVPLTGTGSAPSGKVSVSPTSLSFGTISNGSTSSPQSVTITNATSGSVTLGTGTLSGTDPTDFTISSTTCGTTLAAAGSCTASIAFSPKTTGALAASWTMTVSSSSTALSVTLSGTGATAANGAANVSPTSVSFGSFAVGSPSSTHTVTLTNKATTAIAVNSVTVTGTNASDFNINTNGCRTSALQPNASCSIGVIFTPAASGTRTAALTFVDTANNSPQSSTLTGTGTAANTATITISPSSLSFGTQNVGSTSAVQTFTIAAGGSGTVSLTSESMAGTDPNDFPITANNCGSSINAGSSCTVSVAFKPAAIGNRIALFSVVDNATTTNQVATVSGAGAYSSAQTPAVTVDFGSRSGSQVVIPSDILGTEYFESLPTNANRTTVVQGGFTAARYRLEMQNIFPSSPTAPSWGALNSDMQKFAAANVHPMIILEDTPSFLYPSPLRCSVQPETSVPSDVNQWGQLAAQIVAHLDTTFPGLVYQYEIWNEPNTAALCSSNQLGDYISIYAAAAPQIKNQGKTDNANPAIQVGGPATAGVSGTCSAVGTCTGFSSILTNSSTANYVDFYSYHFYVGTSTSIKDGMTWLPSGTPPSLYSMMMNTSSGVQKRFLQAYSVVKDATTPLGAKTPIFYDEYNDDWAFENDCCRNNATYGPLYNSLVVSQVLDSVYNGAATVPSKMIYFAAAQTTFCILGIVDSSTDCSKAVTGAQAQPYPQWYTYRMMFAPSFLDLQDGGHMAASVTLSSSAKTNQLSATAFYTANNDSVIIINPTASSYSGVTLQINNAGVTPSASTMYTMACPLGHNPTNDASCGTNIVNSFPATLITTSGNLQATFDLPSYSVLAITLKK